MPEKILTHDNYVVPVDGDTLSHLVVFAGYVQSRDGVYVPRHRSADYYQGNIRPEHVDTLDEYLIRRQCQGRLNRE